MKTLREDTVRFLVMDLQNDAGARMRVAVSDNLDGYTLIGVQTVPSYYVVSRWYLESPLRCVHKFLATHCNVPMSAEVLREKMVTIELECFHVPGPRMDCCEQSIRYALTAADNQGLAEPR